MKRLLMFKKQPWLVVVTLGLPTAAFGPVAFLYNDTGFEPSVIITVYTIGAFLYLILSYEVQVAAVAQKSG